jgi:hypothetical protein
MPRHPCMVRLKAITDYRLQNSVDRNLLLRRGFPFAFAQRPDLSAIAGFYVAFGEIEQRRRINLSFYAILP